MFARLANAFRRCVGRSKREPSRSARGRCTGSHRGKVRRRKVLAGHATKRGRRGYDTFKVSQNVLFQSRKFGRGGRLWEELRQLGRWREAIVGTQRPSDRANEEFLIVTTDACGEKLVPAPNSLGVYWEGFGAGSIKGPLPLEMGIPLANPCTLTKAADTSRGSFVNLLNAPGATYST